MSYADVTVLRLESTHYHSDSFETLTLALDEVRRHAAGASVIVDLGRVVLLSSTALRALRLAHQAIDRDGGCFLAAGGGDLVVSVLRFAPFIRHHDRIEDALADLSPDAAAAYSEETRA